MINAICQTLKENSFLYVTENHAESTAIFFYIKS